MAFSMAGSRGQVRHHARTERTRQRKKKRERSTLWSWLRRRVLGLKVGPRPKR